MKGYYRSNIRTGIWGFAEGNGEEARGRSGWGNRKTGDEAREMEA